MAAFDVLVTVPFITFYPAVVLATLVRRHSVELPVCSDRSDGEALPLTREYFSLMPAVRRSSVTTALHILEGSRFYHDLSRTH
jgi:hypothetical protein